MCPDTSLFVTTHGIDVDLEVQCVFAFLYLFWNVKPFGRKKHTETRSAICICDLLSHTILLNWPWDYCGLVENESYILKYFFTHSAQAESVVCWRNTCD